MFATIYAQVGAAILVAVFAFAVWKGDSAERIGAGLNLLAGVVAMAAGSAVSRDLRPTVDLLIDAALATAFLFLALRYASLWLGAAMLLQAGQFSLHAYYLINALGHDVRYAQINNLDSTGINLCILVGAAVSWRRRVLARRESGPEPAALAE